MQRKRSVRSGTLGPGREGNGERSSPIGNPVQMTSGVSSAASSAAPAAGREAMHKGGPRSGRAGGAGIRPFPARRKWSRRIVPILILIASLWLAADSVRVFWADRLYPTVPYFQTRLLPPTVDPRGQIKRLEEAIRIHPYPPAFYFLELGKCYEVLMREALAARGTVVLSGGRDAGLFQEKAVAAYQNAIRREPTNAYAHLALAWALANGSRLLGLPRTPEATLAVNNAVAFAPNDPFVQYSSGYFWFLRASADGSAKARDNYRRLFLKVLTLDGRYRDAVFIPLWQRRQRLQDLEEVTPKTAEGELLLAGFLDSRGLWDEGKEIYASALKEWPEDPALMRAFARALESHGELAAAADLWARILKSGAGRAEAYRKLASLYSRLGEHEEVISTLSALVSLDPERPDYELALARAYAAAGDERETLQEYRRLLTRFPDYAEGHFSLARYQIGRNLIPDALGQLRRAISLDAGKVQYHLTLAGLYARQGEIDLAVEVLESAAKTNPDDSRIYFSLGQLYRQREDLGRALAAFQKSVRLSPENAAYHLTLGSTYDQVGESARALEEYRKAMSESPRDPYPHFYAGRILEQRGLVGAALREYREALMLEPNSATFQTAVKKLE